MLTFKIKGHERDMAFIEIMTNLSEIKKVEMTHLDMTFGNVNTQERNKVMSVVESKESLQKAWEWLQ